MNPVVYLLITLIDLYGWAVIIWAVLGLLIYFRIINAYQPFVRTVNRTLDRLIEPALRPIRRILPPAGGIDVSPIILIVLLNFASYTLVYYF